MSMVTSCPACTTTFRITPEQLQHRHGKVRCGKCSGVFDAFKSLATLADEPPLPQTGPEPVAEPARTPEPIPQQQRLDIEPEPARSTPLELEDTAAAQSNRARPLWIAALIVLCVLLVGQLAYAFRDRLAAALPAARPLLEAMCKPTGCEVAWPRRTDLLAIEASDLQADPARPNIIVLTATLRNRGTVAVARPALELTLTNSQDRMLARRIFTPADYLPGAADAASAMPPLAEVDVRLELHTADLKPAGYRLFLFYP